VEGPLVVGALGGSGTRVVARLLTLAGVFMGSELNEAEDSEPVMRFYRAWLRRYLECGGRLSAADWDAAIEMLHTAVAEHLRGRAQNVVWGVKVPRSILVLPLWLRAFPEFCFVHVVRDGRDMAYSADRNQLRMVGDLVLSRRELRLAEAPKAMTYWQRVNSSAADFGETKLGERYLRLRFEDVCEEPRLTHDRLREFANCRAPAASPEVIEGLVTRPATLGRWRQRPREELAHLEKIGAATLRRFGYANLAIGGSGDTGPC